MMGFKSQVLLSVCVASLVAQAGYGFVINPGAVFASRTLRASPTSALSTAVPVRHRCLNTNLGCARQRSARVTMAAKGTSLSNEEAVSSTRMSRIRDSVKLVFRKIFLGFDPEAEAAEEEAEMPVAAVINKRLEEDAAKAREAAKRVVSAASEEEGEDILSELVQLDVTTSKSPMPLLPMPLLPPLKDEELMASLRRRVEEGPKIDAEGERIAKQKARELKERRERMSREARVAGDTAVAERPRSQSGTGAGVEMGSSEMSPVGRPVHEPKLGSSTDVERLNRLFGSSSAGRS
ncbi:unnamed protein product [Discosporangium mesarthrocarpum]